MTIKQYSKTDALVLLAVILAGGRKGSNLENIIATGDYINHAIFTYKEFKVSIIKLISDGFVKFDKDIYFPTDRILNKYSIVKKARVLKDWDRVYAILNNIQYDKKNKIRLTSHCFSSVIFNKAIKNYQEKANKIIDKLTKK